MLDTLDADKVIEFAYRSIRSESPYLFLKDQVVIDAIRAIGNIRKDRAESRFTATPQSSEVTVPRLTSGILARDLPDLLRHLRYQHVQEPVDRVWAIAGLLSKDIQTKLLPLVDYSDQSRAEYWRTYFQFAKVVLVETQSPSLLHIPRAVNG